MRFRNSFRLLLDNFKNTWALLLFHLITGVITFAVIGVFLDSGLKFLVESAEMDTLRNSLVDIVPVFLGGSGEGFDAELQVAVDNVASAFTALLALVGAHIGEIIFSVVAVAVVYVLGRFFNGLATFAFGDILDNKMSQYSDTPFFAGFFNKIGTAAVYQALYVSLAFVFDALSVVLCYLIFFKLFSFFSVLFTLFCSVAFLVAAQAFKLALITDWMPAVITDGKNLPQAVKESFSAGFGRRFRVAFSNFLMACYCILAVNVLFAVTTFGSALLITVPASYIFLICLQFVHYYTTQNKRYFLSYKEIYDGADLQTALKLERNNKE